MDTDKYGNRTVEKVVKKIKIPKNISVPSTKIVYEVEPEVEPIQPLIEEKVKEPETELIVEEPVIENKIEEVLTFVEEPIKVKPKRVRPSRAKKKKFDFHDVPLPVIRFVAVIISVIAIIRSFGYILSYFLRVDTAFFAILMALMIVLVSFIAPQVLIHSTRAKKYFVALLAVILMGLFTFFNIWVTTSGLKYARNQADYYVASGQENIVKAKRRIEEINRKLIALESDKAVEAKERDTLQYDFDRLTKEEKVGTPEYNSTRSRLNLAKERYDKVNNQITELDNEKKELEKIEGLDSVIIKDEATKQKEASMDVIFAISLDVAGPIFLAFSLFL